ncbi:hypothetical protein [Chitinimonas koreensis]|uniref:hypothetical protein n=1 Tax=Chitinimonas koreensis TaxID=356302 RepID=UPI0006854F5B|nr:hypothetical protein [Chitinimonas koreensis]QNM94892.1 hypothetical protein H9L41_13270 [Chitinimonas koreensis]
MAYTPPSGGAVDFAVDGAAYSPPAGTAVDFNLGHGLALHAVADAVALPVAVSAARLRLRAVVDAAAALAVGTSTLRCRVTSAASAGDLAVGDGTYDHAVFRGPAARAASAWRDAAAGARALPAPWRGQRRTGSSNTPGWRDAARLGRTAPAPWRGMVVVTERAGLAWREAAAVDGRLAAPWRSLQLQQAQAAVGWRDGAPVDQRLDSDWIELSLRSGRTALAYATAAPAAVGLVAPCGSARAIERRAAVPWQTARRPGPGGGGIEPPEPPAFEGRPDLWLHHRWSVATGALWLGRPAELPRILPIRSVYIVLNTVEMYRADGAPLTPTAVGIGTDRDSWAWTLTASLPRAQLPLLQPTDDGPAEVVVIVNGLSWRGLVEEIDEQRGFAAGRVGIRCRSLTAWLADPYAPRRQWTSSSAANARQLAEQALALTGYTLDWGVPDWLVPARLWNIDSAAPLDAVARLVQAAGGILQSAPDERGLIALPRYANMPWTWADLAPDLVIPAAGVRSLGTKFAHKPAYNAVIVSGELDGNVYQVQLQGTAGDLSADDVIDRLVCDPAPARARGLNVLADTGAQAEVTLALPLYAELGRITPGLLLHFGEGLQSWRGLVTGVDIRASVSNRELLIEQALTLERHYP